MRLHSLVNGGPALDSLQGFLYGLFEFGLISHDNRRRAYQFLGLILFFAPVFHLHFGPLAVEAPLDEVFFGEFGRESGQEDHIFETQPPNRVDYLIAGGLDRRSGGISSRMAFRLRRMICDGQ